MRVITGITSFGLISGCVILAATVAAQAQNVPMSASVNGTGCSILVTQPGTIIPVNGFTRFTSDTAGGAPGKAIIRSDDQYTMSIVRPSAWTSSPIPGNGTTAFTSRFRGVDMNGNGVNFNWRTQDQTRKTRNNRNGVTEISIHMTGDYLAGAFPGGTYTAEVTLRCE